MPLEQMVDMLAKSGGCRRLYVDKNMERETGVEPATSSLGNYMSIENTRLMRQSR